MTIKQFWIDPYLSRHLTCVASVADSDVTLRSTIFFAFSGGQESDQGTIAGYPVLRAQAEGTAIVHTLPEGHGLAAGQTVEAEIDWTRRYGLMRLHFAAELVLELFYRALPGVGKIGATVVAYRLRKKLADTGVKLVTLRGLGYLLKLQTQAHTPPQTGSEPT